MPFFHANRDMLIGAFLVLCSLAVLLFPHRFGHPFYGIRTRWTFKNKHTWKEGHRLFALFTSAIGMIIVVLGYFHQPDLVPPVAMFALIFVLWKASEWSVHRILANRHPDL
jgi:uncharacterized membrane protein